VCTPNGFVYMPGRVVFVSSRVLLAVEGSVGDGSAYWTAEFSPSIKSTEYV
jgi:hypothetical protein